MGQSMVEPCLLLLVNLAIRCNGADARLYRFRFPSVLPVIVEKEKKKSSTEAELLSCCLPGFEANVRACHPLGHRLGDLLGLLHVRRLGDRLLLVLPARAALPLVGGVSAEVAPSPAVDAEHGAVLGMRLVKLIRPPPFAVTSQ